MLYQLSYARKRISDFIEEAQGNQSNRLMEAVSVRFLTSIVLDN